MIEKFKTLLFVKTSLISLYLALTIPIPFISNENLKILSIISFIFGLLLIINITDDYVNTSDNKISYKTSFVSKIFGKKTGKFLGKILNLLNLSQLAKAVRYIISFVIKMKIFLFHKGLKISKSLYLLLRRRQI